MLKNNLSFFKMYRFFSFFFFLLFLVVFPSEVYAKKYTLDQLGRVSPMVKTKRVTPGSNMVMKKSGVPSFTFVKRVRVKLSNGKFKTRTFRLKQIPRLQVGRESRVKVRPMRLVIKERQQLKGLLEAAGDGGGFGGAGRAGRATRQAGGETQKKGGRKTKGNLAGFKKLKTISPKKFQAMMDKIIGEKNLEGSSLVSAEEREKQRQAATEAKKQERAAFLKGKEKRRAKQATQAKGENQDKTQAETNISWRDIQFRLPSGPRKPTINERLVKVVEKLPRALTSEDLKLLRALIFLNVHKEYYMAIGLFAELFESKKWSHFAQYNMGLVMNRLNLYHGFRYRMFTLLQESPEWEQTVLMEMVKSLPSYEIYFASQIEPYVNRYRLSGKDAKNVNLFHLLIAKEALEKNDIGEVIYRVDQIQKSSPHYLEGRFLRGVMNYKKGQIAEAEKEFKAVFRKLKHTGQNLKSLAALNLARLHFQKGQYRKAFALYNDVGKNHPTFIESLMEKAWNQVLYGDYAGAAGNMFSIQTEYFAEAFKPESYVIRSVGYLNLCQYGDSVQILKTFKKRYRPVVKMMKKYIQSHKKDKTVAYYNTVKKTLVKGAKVKRVDGLPRVLVLALARHPAFVDNQLVVNNIEDQRARWKHIFIQLLKTEKDLRQRTKGLIAEIKKVKADYKKEVAKGKPLKFTLAEQVDPLKQRKVNYGIRYLIAQKSRKVLKMYRDQEGKRLQAEKVSWIKRTDKFLKARFASMYDDLRFSVDQAGTLAYEIHSGAADTLRHQLAGGKTQAESGDRKLASKKELAPEEGQGQKWSFSGKGELWQDEVGNFRSSLKNVCPKEEKVTQAENSQVKTSEKEEEQQ